MSYLHLLGCDSSSIGGGEECAQLGEDRLIGQQHSHVECGVIERSCEGACVTKGSNLHKFNLLRTVLLSHLIGVWVSNNTGHVLYKNHATFAAVGDAY